MNKLHTIHIQGQDGGYGGYVMYVDSMLGSYPFRHVLFRIDMPLIYHLHMGKVFPFVQANIDKVDVDRCYVPAGTAAPDHTLILRGYKFAINTASQLQAKKPNLAILNVPAGSCIPAWYELDWQLMDVLMRIQETEDIAPYIRAMREIIVGLGLVPPDARTPTNQELPKTPPT